MAAGKLKAAGAGEADFTPRRGRPSLRQAAAISQTILDAATQLFLDEGFERTSMEAVTARAGVPKSTLYKRFTDKKALLRAVVEARVAGWSAAAAQNDWMLTDDLEQRLRHYAAILFTSASSPDLRAFSALASSAWNDEEDPLAWLEVLGFKHMFGLIERDVAAFGPADGSGARDPQTVATTLMALTFGALQLRAARGPATETEAEAFAAFAAGLIMRGAAAP